jgi:hypothetical protein
LSLFFCCLRLIVGIDSVTCIGHKSK